MTTDERLALIRDRHRRYLRDPLAVAARFVPDDPDATEPDEDADEDASDALAPPDIDDEMPAVLTVRGGEVRYGA